MFSCLLFLGAFFGFAEQSYTKKEKKVVVHLPGTPPPDEVFFTFNFSFLSANHELDVQCDTELMADEDIL